MCIRLSLILPCHFLLQPQALNEVRRRNSPPNLMVRRTTSTCYVLYSLPERTFVLCVPALLAVTPFLSPTPPSTLIYVKSLRRCEPPPQSHDLLGYLFTQHPRTQCLLPTHSLFFVCPLLLCPAHSQLARYPAARKLFFSFFSCCEPLLSASSRPATTLCPCIMPSGWGDRTSSSHLLLLL